MAVLLAYLNVPLSWRDVFKRTLKESFERQLPRHGRAARLLFLLRAVPGAPVLIAVASYFPLETLIDDVFACWAALPRRRC